MKTAQPDLHHTASRLLPPGPRGLPGVGVLPWIWRDPLVFLEATVRRHGDVARFQLGRKDVYLVSDPNLISQIFQREKSEKTTSAFNETMRSVFGEGLLTLRGDPWSDDRRLLQPAFTKRAASEITPLFVEQTRRRLAIWVSGSIIDVAEEMRVLTSAIATHLLLGSSIAEADRLIVYRALTVINQQLFKQLLLPSFARLPTPGNRALRRNLVELNTIIEQGIQAQEHTNDESQCFPLSAYLGCRFASRQRLRDHLLTLLFGGQETTANALAWCLYLIAKHPNVAAKLKAEQEAVLGIAPPTSDAIARLKYTRAALEEAMRLYPPSYLLTPRNGDKPLIGNRVVPPHAQLIISQYVMHRHPDYWDQPKAFIPERFNTAPPKFVYFPFGAGPQICVGAQIAMHEMITALAMIVQAFRLELIDPPNVVPQAWITLRPRFGVWVKLHKAR